MKTDKSEVLHLEKTHHRHEHKLDQQLKHYAGNQWTEKNTNQKSKFCGFFQKHISLK